MSMQYAQVFVKLVVVKCVFFFFQAEDGIRDLTVTGVQTCALPISEREHAHGQHNGREGARATPEEHEAERREGRADDERPTSPEPVDEPAPPARQEDRKSVV